MQERRPQPIVFRISVAWLSAGVVGLALAASAESAAVRAAVEALAESSHPMALEATFPLEKTAAFHAVAALGPNAIPALGERLESSDAPEVRVLLGTALFRVAGFTFYWHSGDESGDLGGMSLRHPKGEPIPLLSCRIGREHLGEMPGMEIAWRAWQQARRDLASGSLREEIAGIGHVPEDASPDVVDALHARYRLAQARYGICAVPALVTRVHQHEDQLAFLTFLRIARPVRYLTLNAPAAPGPALAHLASAWPTHAERVSAVRAWWAEARPTFSLLPDLQGEIDAAVAALPEPES